jgi:hypothetical protein
MLRSAAFFQTGDLKNAETALENALHLFRVEEKGPSLAFLENSLGRIYFETGRVKLANAALKKASRLWKKAGKLNFALDARSLFEKLAQIENS